MIKFIKNFLGLKKHNNVVAVKIVKEEDSDLVQSTVSAYFNSFNYYDKYHIEPLDVNHFCKELRMNDEDLAKVHKLIKDRLIEIKLEQIQGDFND